MKTTKIVLLLVVLVAAIGGYLFFGDMLGRGAVAAVNRYGPPVTGTQVALGSAHLSPLSGGGWLRDLFIGNPTGFHTAKAFSVREVSIAVKPLSLFGDTLDVQEVVVANPEFIFETKLVSSNLGTILENVRRHTEADGETATEQPTAGTAKKIIIRHFVLENARVTVAVGNTTLEVPLAKLELHDIGVAKGGVTPAQAAAEILPEVLTMVTKTAVASLSDRTFRDKATDFGKELGSAAQDLLDQLRGK